MKIIPLGDRYFFKLRRNCSLLSICSITSCMRISGKCFCKSFNKKISEAMKVPFCLLVMKKFCACSIRDAAISIPMTSQPSSAKGSRFPPSPHPTSSIFFNIRNIIISRSLSLFLKITFTVCMSFLHLICLLFLTVL